MAVKAEIWPGSCENDLAWQLWGSSQLHHVDEELTGIRGDLGTGRAIHAPQG